MKGVQIVVFIQSLLMLANLPNVHSQPTETGLPATNQLPTECFHSREPKPLRISDCELSLQAMREDEWYKTRRTFWTLPYAGDFRAWRTPGSTCTITLGVNRPDAEGRFFLHENGEQAVRSVETTCSATGGKQFLYTLGQRDPTYGWYIELMTSSTQQINALDGPESN